MKVQSRTFVISGGASGLGAAVTEDIVKEGGNVAILDKNEDDGNSLAKKLSSSAKFFAVDVTQTESITAAVKGVVDWANQTGKPLGGVIAAAGVAIPGLILNKSLDPLSISSIDLVLNINLRGTLDLVRQVIPHLARGAPSGPDGERGIVVMIASNAAFDGQTGQVAYAASKGGIASVTLPLARDLSRHGIRVVTIAPSLFETPMASLMSDKVRQGLQKSMEFPPRPGQPKEFAQLVRHAIENVMLNGVVIRLDGASRMPARL